MNGRNYIWVGFLLLAASSLDWSETRTGSDWPQWRGPLRDGRSPEESLVDGWSQAGPVEIWRRFLGKGYSGMAILDGQLFTMVQDDAEYVVALDALTGEQLWRVRSDTSFFHEEGDGPRGTPTVVDGIVYTVGAQGMFLATEATTGEVLWCHDLVDDIGGAKPKYGYATSPLVDGHRVFVEPGGHRGHSLAAFDRHTGRLIWGVFQGPAGYSSPMTANMKDLRQVLFFTAKHLVSVSAAQGQVLWQYPWETEDDINAATPVWIPPDRVFVSSWSGGAVLEIRMGSHSAQTVWKNQQMRNYFSSSLLFEGYLYGFDMAGLKCLDADTGRTMWIQGGFGDGSLILADRKLLILNAWGDLILAKATPTRYAELAKASILEKPCYTPPSLARHKLYLRNESEVVCLDLAR